MNKINIKFYAMFEILGDSKSKMNEDGKLQMVEEFLNDIERLSNDEFKEIFDNGFTQIRNSNCPKIPGFLMLDILSNYVDKLVPNGKGNVNQKRKANIIKRIKSAKKRTFILNYDNRFNPTYELSSECIQDIVRTKGNFFLDFRDVNELDEYDYEILGNRVVLGYFGDIPSEVYEVRNGKLTNVESSTLHVSGFAYNEEKEKVDEEYMEAIQEYVNDIIDEIGNFFDGYFPKTYEEARQLLLEKGYDYTKHSELFDSMKFRYKYLKDRSIKNRNEIEFIHKPLISFKRNPKIKPTKKQAPTPTKFGVFSRVRNYEFTKTNQSREERVKRFDNEREKQEERDKEIIDVVIYQRRVVNGKEELNKLDNDEYKVVRR